MKNDQSTAKEQLDLIEQTIAQAKENLSNHSFAFIFWGWLVSLTALLNYVLLTYSSLENYSYFIWPIAMIMGVVYIIRYYKTVEKTASHRTYLEYFLSRMWMVIGIVLILFSFATPFIRLNPWFFFPLVAGIGTIVSGVVLKFNPLIIGGIVLLGFPFYCVLVEGSYLMLLYAIVIMISYLLPGYALKRHRS
jgi:hypothetical protein